MAAGESAQQGAPCLAFIPREPTPAGAAGAPSFSSLRWREGTNELRVFFRVGNKSGQIPTWRLTVHTSPLREFITRERILDWANVWHREATQKGATVPKFVLTDSEDDSHIRVMLSGKNPPD